MGLYKFYIEEPIQRHYLEIMKKCASADIDVSPVVNGTCELYLNSFLFSMILLLNILLSISLTLLIFVADVPDLFSSKRI